MLKTYDAALRLADIQDTQPNMWDVAGATHIRVTLPAHEHYGIEMQKRGFLLADRTIKASISLGTCHVDFEKMIRLPIVESAAYKDDIFRIACAAFTYDRRFHIKPDCDAQVAHLVLREYVDDLDTSLVCFFRDQVIGFLALKPVGENALFVHLAAVEEKYRMAGAAMALYAKACLVAKEKGYKKLEGRISSRNMAVMNVYTAFGARFSDPYDIFLKEVLS